MCVWEKSGLCSSRMQHNDSKTESALFPWRPWVPLTHCLLINYNPEIRTCFHGHRCPGVELVGRFGFGRTLDVSPFTVLMCPFCSGPHTCWLIWQTGEHPNIWNRRRDRRTLLKNICSSVQWRGEPHQREETYSLAWTFWGNPVRTSSSSDWQTWFHSKILFFHLYVEFWGMEKSVRTVATFQRLFSWPVGSLGHFVNKIHKKTFLEIKNT